MGVGTLKQQKQVSGYAEESERGSFFSLDKGRWERAAHCCFLLHAAAACGCALLAACGCALLCACYVLLLRCCFDVLLLLLLLLLQLLQQQQTWRNQVQKSGRMLRRREILQASLALQK